jgi:hypothetical protein
MPRALVVRLPIGGAYHGCTSVLAQLRGGRAGQVCMDARFARPRFCGLHEARQNVAATRSLRFAHRGICSDTDGRADCA